MRDADNRINRGFGDIKKWRVEADAERRIVEIVVRGISGRIAPGKSTDRIENECSVQGVPGRIEIVEIVVDRRGCQHGCGNAEQNGTHRKTRNRYSKRDFRDCIAEIHKPMPFKKEEPVRTGCPVLKQEEAVYVSRPLA